MNHYEAEFFELQKQVRYYLQILESVEIATQALVPIGEEKPIRLYILQEPWPFDRNSFETLQRAVQEDANWNREEHGQAQVVHQTIPGLLSGLLRRNQRELTCALPHGKESLIALRDSHRVLWTRLVRVCSRNQSVARCMLEIAQTSVAPDWYIVHLRDLVKSL